MSVRLGFVLFPILLIVAACEQILEPSPEAREVPTYRVVGGPLEAPDALALLAALGVPVQSFSPETYLNEDGSVFFLDEERFQYLPMIETDPEGSADEEDGPFTTFSFDEKAILTIPVPPRDDGAIADVQAALKEAGFHPLDLMAPNTAEVVAVAGHSRFEMLEDDQVTTRLALDLDTHVDFQIRLAADVGFLDLVGPGASVKVVLVADGPTLVHHEFWHLEPDAMVAVIGQDEALDACRSLYRSDAAPQGSAVTQHFHIDVSADLVYYAPPFEVATSTIYPYYECSGTMLLDGGKDGSELVTLRPTMVAAASEAPAIFSPPETSPVRPNDTAFTSEPLAFGVHDAGTQWVGTTQGLPGSSKNAGRFFDVFDAVANVDARFNWGDLNAWERDFRDPAFGGSDTQWIDNVDVAFYTGHANGNGFTFSSAVDDGFLAFDEARWGNHDLEWLVIAACGPLQLTTNGLSWAQRWGPAFDGLHLLMAYANDSRDNEREGRIFARAILGEGESPKRVRTAWVKAATTVQPSSVTFAVMGVATSNGVSNWNDYFWGRGTGGGPDIRGSDIRYYWRLSGPS